jgi:hypothetical protein
MHAATHPANLPRSIRRDVGDIDTTASAQTPEEAVSDLFAALDAEAEEERRDTRSH